MRPEWFLTIATSSTLHVDMKVLVALQRLLEQLYLLIALNPPGFCICLALAVALHLVQLDHLLNSILVLFFYAEFEFELRKHELDAGSKMGSVIFDQI